MQNEQTKQEPYKEVLARYADTLQYRKDEELDRLLEEAYRQMKRIGLPLPKFHTICILSAHFRGGTAMHAAESMQVCGWNFIFIRDKFKEEPGEKFYTKATIMHELLHLCHAEGETWHPDHDQQFLAWGKQIEQEYGIRVMDIGGAYRYSHNKVVIRYECPKCGCREDIYEGNTKRIARAKKVMADRNRYRIPCPYCHAETKIREL